MKKYYKIYYIHDTFAQHYQFESFKNAITYYLSLLNNSEVNISSLRIERITRYKYKLDEYKDITGDINKLLYKGL